MNDRQTEKLTVAETWAELLQDARRLEASEPILKDFLTIFTATFASFPLALSLHLADLLHSARVPSKALSGFFSTVLEADESICVAAAADLRAICDRDPACSSNLLAFMNFKGFQALQTYRIAHSLWVQGRRELAIWLSNRASLVFGPDIHPAAQIGWGILLDHGAGIVIGETSVVDDNVSILQGVTLGGTGKDLGDRHPKIRTGVMVGAGAKILGNIEIGAFSKVAAGSVVLQQVPEGCTVAGVPARIVRRNNASEIPSHVMDQHI